MKIYKKIALHLKQRDGSDFFESSDDSYKKSINEIIANHAPSGLGFDKGVEFLFDSSNSNRLVFHTQFHHVNKSGKYCGWTHHDIYVIPDLYSDFTIEVFGINRFGIKKLIENLFTVFLYKEIL